jgi:hypothetical protein
MNYTNIFIYNRFAFSLTAIISKLFIRLAFFLFCQIQDLQFINKIQDLQLFNSNQLCKNLLLDHFYFKYTD